MVHSMANVIPDAAARLPLRAVSGCDNIFKPKMKETDAMRYITVSMLISIYERELGSSY
jgi:hypothetical protein